MKMLMDLGRWEEAAPLAHGLMEHPIDQPWAQIGLARLALTQGRVEEAEHRLSLTPRFLGEPGALLGQLVRVGRTKSVIRHLRSQGYPRDLVRDWIREIREGRIPEEVWRL